MFCNNKKNHLTKQEEAKAWVLGNTTSMFLIKVNQGRVSLLCVLVIFCCNFKVIKECVSIAQKTKNWKKHQRAAERTLVSLVINIIVLITSWSTRNRYGIKFSLRTCNNLLQFRILPEICANFQDYNQQGIVSQGWSPVVHQNPLFNNCLLFETDVT